MMRVAIQNDNERRTIWSGRVGLPCGRTLAAGRSTLRRPYNRCPVAVWKESTDPGERSESRSRSSSGDYTRRFIDWRNSAAGCHAPETVSNAEVLERGWAALPEATESPRLRRHWKKRAPTVSVSPRVIREFPRASCFFQALRPTLCHLRVLSNFRRSWR